VGAALDRQNATRLFEVEGAGEGAGETAPVAEPAEV
jgi:hypothetical protein